MSIKINNSGISNISSDTDRIYTIYKGDKLIKFNYAPVVNYIFRDTDENGNLTLATGNLEDGSEITKISDYGMYYGFANSNDLIGGVSLPNLKLVGNGGMSYAFYYASGLTGDLYCPNLTRIDSYGFSQAFYGTNIKSVDLSNLISIGTYALQDAFSYNNSLESINLSSLSSVESQGLRYACRSCPNLKTINLRSHTRGIDATMFSGDTSIENIDLSSLNYLGASALAAAFQNCVNLQTLSFPSLNSNSFGSYTNQFNGMLIGVTGCTVHFPSNLQSVIGSWNSVTSGFSGTNTIVLFDLPETE